MRVESAGGRCQAVNRELPRWVRLRKPVDGPVAGATSARVRLPPPLPGDADHKGGRGPRWPRRRFHARPLPDRSPTSGGRPGRESAVRPASTRVPCSSTRECGSAPAWRNPVVRSTRVLTARASITTPDTNGGNGSVTADGPTGERLTAHRRRAYQRQGHARRPAAPATAPPEPTARRLPGARLEQRHRPAPHTELGPLIGRPSSREGRVRPGSREVSGSGAVPSPKPPGAFDAPLRRPGRASGAAAFAGWYGRRDRQDAPGSGRATRSGSVSPGRPSSPTSGASALPVPRPRRAS